MRRGAMAQRLTINATLGRFNILASIRGINYYFYILALVNDACLEDDKRRHWVSPLKVSKIGLKRGSEVQILACVHYLLTQENDNKNKWNAKKSPLKL